MQSGTDPTLPPGSPARTAAEISAAGPAPGGGASTGGRPRVALPEWMRDPAASPVPVRRRWIDRLAEHPGLRRAREAWWRWRDRPRLSERYPRAVPVISFFVVAAVASLLVAATLYVFVTMRSEIWSTELELPR
ncbi:hypothetical protein AB0J86_20780 [Micromonospora sp. NPDC049559]|uniref:hypothetical protein n=1 Tax=Micromonospora sp. NPDC049559 TaxID=3155923 RepID=UPI00342A8E23